MNSVTAIIVTYNRLELLKKVIKALREQTRKPDSIIVVNNGSTDNTAQWLSEQKDIQTFHQNNQGASGGFFRGIKEALDVQSEWIWIMDDDVEPDKHCLATLLSFENDTMKIIAPQRYQDGKPFRPEPVLCNFNNPFKSLWVRHPNDSDYINGVAKVECGTFEGPLVHHSVFEKVGLPDKDFFIFADDTEFFERCWRNGFPTYIVTDAKLHRMIPFVSTETPVWKRYYEIRNVAVLDMRFGNIFVKILRPMFYALKMLVRSRNVFEIRSIIIGWYHGIIGRLGER